VATSYPSQAQKGAFGCPKNCVCSAKVPAIRQVASPLTELRAMDILHDESQSA